MPITSFSTEHINRAAALSKSRFHGPRFPYPLGVLTICWVSAKTTDCRGRFGSPPCSPELPYVLANGLCFTNVLAEHHGSMFIRVLFSCVSGYGCLTAPPDA